jgi:mono/diheme cytochrome c family protein
VFVIRLIDRLFATSGVLMLTGGASLGAAGFGPGHTPASVFATKCSSCHTFGQGERVGPDLKGVTARHSRSWLVSWIRSSERMVRSGNVVAVALFRKYRQQRMPDHAFDDAEINALIDYLARGGPEADSERRFRLATTATRKEVERGRGLFFGWRGSARGDMACAVCHSLSRQPALAGGSLGPDLTHAYSKYQDRALGELLERSCVPRLTDASSVGAGATRRAEMAADAFALRAFLRQVDLDTGKVGLHRIATQGAASGS